jgi:putative selenium metabolism hydrolase
MRTIDFAKVKELAERYKPDMTRFLRDMIRLPSESCQEKAVVQRIKEEMEKVGFDKVVIDPMGNVLGYIGTGKHLIAMDAHIDTVGVGNRDNWKFDPYEGFEDEEIIIGRGASDQEGGMASMVYAGKIIKDLGLEGDYTLVVVGTVQEEDCDGLCWQYIVRESGITPEFVVSTEPTDGGIYRGQRGRMEIKVKVSGLSAHGSAPERGDNAIFKMGPILAELQELHGRLRTDAFLGKGSLTVSEIFFTSPSRCAVADSCTISIDRRLTVGEDRELAIKQISELPAVKEARAEVSLYPYDKPSYTGLVYPTDCYFPTWVIPDEHVVTRSAADTYKSLFEQEPRVDKWTFSTNGVSIMGMFGIPCVGFGPVRNHRPMLRMKEPGRLTWFAALPFTLLCLWYTWRKVEDRSEREADIRCYRR